MSFEERLHPRSPDGKFGHGGNTQSRGFKVTSRRRNGPAVTEDKPAGGAKPPAGPKDASHAELVAADKAGKAVQMHRLGDDGKWAPEGPPGSMDSQVDRARSAIIHHGQAGRIRLTVVDKPAAPAGAMGQRDKTESVTSRSRGGEATTTRGRPEQVPAGARKVTDDKGAHIGYMATSSYESHNHAAGSRSSASTSRGKQYHAHRPDGTRLPLTFYHPDDAKRALREEHAKARIAKRGRPSG